jgi:hypothetical protein
MLSANAFCARDAVRYTRRLALDLAVDVLNGVGGHVGAPWTAVIVANGPAREGELGRAVDALPGLLWTAGPGAPDLGGRVLWPRVADSGPLEGPAPASRGLARRSDVERARPKCNINSHKPRKCCSLLKDQLLIALAGIEDETSGLCNT